MRFSAVSVIADEGTDSSIGCRSMRCRPLTVDWNTSCLSSLGRDVENCLIFDRKLHVLGLKRAGYPERAGTTALSNTIKTASTSNSIRRLVAGSFWPGANATDEAKAIRGGEAIMAAEPATFWAASAMRGLTLTCVAAEVVAVENMAAAPVFEPVKYPPNAPIAGMNTIETEPIEAAVVASSDAIPLADITVPSTINNSVIAVTGHHR